MSNLTLTPANTKWRLSVFFALGGSVLVGLVVVAFVWPTATGSTHNLPVAIAGPAAQTQAVEKAIDTSARSA